MIGSTLGSYEIKEEIGRGGMATVYRAYQANVDRDVAIKVITKNVRINDATIMRFQREARLIARLEHPHVLPVYDFDGAHDPPYIVMRYLESGTLKDIIKRQQLPMNEVAYLINQIGAALDYAHRQGIVHRDIKPSNIMIDREGNAFVTDFGIARIIAGPATDSQITAEGMTVGTPDYMSPEQAIGSEMVDHRTDIYALGVMLFQMLTGILPFESTTPMGVLMMQINNPVPQPTRLNPALPAMVDEVILRSMMKDPDARFQTMAQFTDAAVTALGGTVSGKPVQLQQVAGETLTGSMRTDRAVARTDSQHTPSEQNKTITAMVVQAAEYTEMVEARHGVEAAKGATQKLWDTAAEIITARGGSVCSRTDDTVLALWGATVASEEDAEQTIRTALAIQSALRKQAREMLDGDGEEEPFLPLNIGINTGMALLSPRGQTSDYTASGATISLTNRLSQHAYGSILITHDTYSQVRGVFDVEVDTPLKIRGRRDRINVYRVIAEKPRPFRVRTLGVEGVETQLIGRDAELVAIQNAFMDATEESETQVVTLVGDAGLGKSRLLYEFRNWSDLAGTKYWHFHGRAVAQMTLRPYALLRNILSLRFQILENDRADVVREKMEIGVAYMLGRSDHEMTHRMGYLCGFDFSDSPHLQGLMDDPQQLTSLARQAAIRFFTALAKAYPVVVFVEDIHHADDASLDLLNDLVTGDDRLSLLIICAARPTLLDRRPNWGSGLDYHQRIVLEPLDRRSSRNLVREILQKVEDLPKSLRDTIVDHAEGNPYFMEEVVKILIEDRVIIKESEAVWRVEESRLENLRVPPTLAGLLQARFDTLLYPEKLTLQRASVVGRVFYDTALEWLDAADDIAPLGESLPDILTSLIERGFIRRRETSAFAGSKEYIFAGNMLRDMIYDRLLRRHRIIYHRTTAEWLVDAAGERVAEYTPLIAQHYAKAGELSKAAQYLREAGEKAARISAFTAARDFFDQALVLLPDDSAEAMLLNTKLGDVLLRMGDLSNAAYPLETALKLARQFEDSNAQTHALYHLSQLATTRGDFAHAVVLLGEALPLARASDDRATLARVLYGLSDTHFRCGNEAEARAAGEECLAIAREIGHEALQIFALNRLGTIESTFTKNFDKSRVLFDECLTLARRNSNRNMEGATLTNLGNIAYYQENWESAIKHAEDALAIYREITSPRGTVIALNNLAQAFMQVNRLDEAHRLIIEALEIARQMDSATWMISGIANIIQLKTIRGDYEQALALLDLVQNHPATSSDTLDDLNPVIEELRAKVPRKQFAAGKAKGKDLEFYRVVDDLLAQAR